MPDTIPNHAIVFGASGTAGWGVVDSLLRSYPSPSTYSHITAVTNRPLFPNTTLWPSGPNHPTLNLVSGLDLTVGTPTTFTSQLHSLIPSASTITHVYYFAYLELASISSATHEVAVNLSMLRRVVEAIVSLAPNFRMLVYPGGSKAYGIHAGGGFYTPPYRESVPRLPAPHCESVNYFAFRDYLSTASAGKPWSWSEICPDAVIGYTPNGSQFSLVALWGNYLSLYAAVHGKGAEVAFPGNEGCWRSRFNEASSEMLGRCAIWAAENPGVSAGQVFNVADRAEPHSWEENWGRLAGYFGLVGVGPEKEGVVREEERVRPSVFVEEHKRILVERGIRANEVVRADFLDQYGYFMDYDRWFSLEKVREAGFREEADPVEGWIRTWDNFKRTGLLMQ